MFLSFFSFYFASLIPSSAMYISFIIIPPTWRCFCRAESGGLNERVLYFWMPVMLYIYISMSSRLVTSIVFCCAAKLSCSNRGIGSLAKLAEVARR